MPTDDIFAGYTSYTDTQEVLASADVDPDELASIPIATTIAVSSVPCGNFTIAISVAFSC